MTPTPRRGVAALVAVSMATTACLSSSFHIPADELQRLARVAPTARWQTIRSTQRIFTSDTPPPVALAMPTMEAPTVVPAVYWYAGRAFYVPNVWRQYPAGWSTRATLSGGGSSGSSSGGRSGSGNGAGAVAAVVVAAALIVFVAAASEGARFDGWMGLPPDEPLYLTNFDGSTTLVPLSSLTPELADQARGADVYEGREERYLRLARAPLNRQGFSAQSSATLAMVPPVRVGGSGYAAAFGGRAFFGGFPIHQLGLGVTTDILAGMDESIIANVGAEVQVMPLNWVGAYVGGGWSIFNAQNPPRSFVSWYVRAGALLELPITTRLGGTLRLGGLRIETGGSWPAAWVPELSLGLSVY